MHPQECPCWTACQTRARLPFWTQNRPRAASTPLGEGGGAKQLFMRVQCGCPVYSLFAVSLRHGLCRRPCNAITRTRSSDATAAHRLRCTCSGRHIGGEHIAAAKQTPATSCGDPYFLKSFAVKFSFFICYARRGAMLDFIRDVTPDV
jgi:hypothetical protein